MRTICERNRYPRYKEAPLLGKLPNTVMLSTFAALSVNSARGLSRGVRRCFATLSMTRALSMTGLHLNAKPQLGLMPIGRPSWSPCNKLLSRRLARRRRYRVQYAYDEGYNGPGTALGGMADCRALAPHASLRRYQQPGLVRGDREWRALCPASDRYQVEGANP